MLLHRRERKKGGRKGGKFTTGMRMVGVERSECKIHYAAKEKRRNDGESRR